MEVPALYSDIMCLQLGIDRHLLENADASEEIVNARVRSVMKNIKRVLIAMCMCTMLAHSCPPPARAQAAAVQPLADMAIQFACQLAPLALPVVATVVITGLQKATELPALIKERMPSFRRRPKLASAGVDGTAEAAPEAAVSEDASTVSGGTNSENEQTATADVSCQVRIPVRQKSSDSSSAESDAATEVQDSSGSAYFGGRPQEPKEGSDWYVD